MPRPAHVGVILSAFLVTLLLIPPSAHARTSTAAEIARAWGLLGNWGTDCSKPASPQNPRLSYRSERDGTIVHFRDFKTRRDSLKVLSLSQTPGGMLELVIDFPALKHQRKLTVTKGADGRIRAYANVELGSGKFSVQDGVMLHTGKMTEWQSRCELLSA